MMTTMIVDVDSKVYTVPQTTYRLDIDTATTTTGSTTDTAASSTMNKKPCNAKVHGYSIYIYINIPTKEIFCVLE